MKVIPVVWANVRRRKARTLLTALSTTLSFAIVAIVWAAYASFQTGFATRSANHLVTLNKIAPFMPMPVSHVLKIEGVEGVASVGFDASFRGYYRDRKNPVNVLAAREQTFFATAQDDVLVDSAAMERWSRTRTAALVSESLAKRYQWKPGDRIPLLSDIRRRDGDTLWTLDIVGIYANRDGSESQTIYIPYAYLNESRLVGKDTVDSFDVLVRSSRDAATVAERIDALFANASPQTRTAPLSVILQDILRQLGDIGFIAGALSVVVFLSMLVISSAAMISNTREGLSEYALFGAIGYRRSDLLLIAISEPLAWHGGLRYRSPEQHDTVNSARSARTAPTA